MNEHIFLYKKYDWVIKFIYDVTCKDTSRILCELSKIGCVGKDLIAAQNNIDSCEENCGITFANMRTREMIVVITESTSNREFLNTVVHEIHHMCEFIAKSSSVPQTGEAISYIAGDLAYLMYDCIHKKLCPHCGK